MKTTGIAGTGRRVLELVVVGRRKRGKVRRWRWHNRRVDSKQIDSGMQCVGINGDSRHSRRNSNPLGKMGKAEEREKHGKEKKGEEKKKKDP